MVEHLENTIKFNFLSDYSNFIKNNFENKYHNLYLLLIVLFYILQQLRVVSTQNYLFNLMKKIKTFIFQVKNAKKYLLKKTLAMN